MKILDICYYCLFRAAERSHIKDDAMEAAAMFLPVAFFLNLFLLFSIATNLVPVFHAPHINISRPEVYTLAIGAMILSYFRYCRGQKGKVIAGVIGKQIDSKSGAFWGKIIFFETILTPISVALYYSIKVPFQK